MNSNSRALSVLKYIIMSVIFAAIYFLMAKFSLKITKIPSQTSAFYIPAGFAVALVLIFGLRYLPVIFFAKVILGLHLDRPFMQIFASCMASTIEAYIGMYLYESFKENIEDYFEYQSNLALSLLISILAPVFSALIGVTHLHYVGIVDDQHYFSHFLTWYAGDVIGILIFVPLFLHFDWKKNNIFDFISPVIAFAATWLFIRPEMAPYIYLLFFVLLIPTIFSANGMGIYYSLATIALTMNWFLINHTGPFSEGSYPDNLLSIQFFLFAIAISALTLEGFRKTGVLKSALVPLISFWLLSGGIYYYYHSLKLHANLAIISEIVGDFESRLNEKMNNYENALRGASGFVAGSELVEKNEWEEYIKSIGIVDSENGIHGVGLILPKNGKNPGISYVYPPKIDLDLDFKNIANIPEIAPLFLQAANIEHPLLSPVAVYNLKDGSPIYLSFLITSVKKNNLFYGWIVTPINMSLFFKSLAEKRYQDIDIDIYDGEVIDPAKKIYTKIVDGRLRGKSQGHTLLSTLNLGGRSFTIDWNETMRFVTSQGSQNSFFLLIGALFSIVLTGFILNLKLINVKAHRIANSKTMELKESEERFKSLFENSSDAVILFNNTEIIDCNPESLELFGKRSKKELISTPLFDFFAIRDLNMGENRQLFESKMKEVKIKKMVKFECFCLRANLPFFAEMHLHYIEVNEKFIFQAVVRDISERKKIEQNLTKSKELAEDAARAKSNFLSTMSHEIRTPLNGVIGMVNIILDENPKTEIREDLETIKYSADNLLHIVNEVLDYNKIESGKIDLEKNPFNLKNLCENILKIHRPKAVEKNLELNFDFDQKIPEVVIGDEYRNNQILNNLLSNSLKFTDEGSVTLHVRLKQNKEHSCIIEFKVSDTGIGIDMTKQREIFKDFTQAESDHTRKYGGTGLGLAITKRLVEIQGGRIDVQSNEFQGTSFIYNIHFNLTAETSDGAATSVANNEMKGFSGERVLLVEDNQVNIIVTKKFLEKWGLKVDVAINGLEAVNHVRAIKYGLILMDLHMPLMDGFEATKKIREFNTDTPIVGLSADVMTESVSSLQSIGMNDFVTKPFRPNDFFQKLKRYI